MKFDLQKATEKAKFTLAKKGIPNVKAAVVLNLDVSGSARGLFNSGAMQEAFQQIVPLATLFDDNGSLQVFTFASGENYISEISPEANASNFEGYINKNILNSGIPLWGATEYTQILKANLESLGYYKKGKTGLFGFGGGEKQLVKDNGSGFPSFILTFTDGANSDHSSTMKFLKECQDAETQAYFMFVGIGNKSEFRNIEKYGEALDNVGFLSVSDLQKFVGSDDIYEQLLCEELVEWFKK